MRFIGISESGFKIEDVPLEGVSKLVAKYETSWLDVDKMDVNIEADMGRLFGINKILEPGYPKAEPVKDEFDRVVLNYYENSSRFELQAFVSKNLIITVHEGKDAVVEETIASLNEIFGSGDYSPPAIFAYLLLGVVEKNETEIDLMEKGSRKAILRVKSNDIDIEAIFTLEKNLRRMSRTIHVTKVMVSDVMNQNIKTPYLKDGERLRNMYMSLDLQDHTVADLYEMMRDIIESMVPRMWLYLNSVRKLSTGAAFFGAIVGAGLLLYSYLTGGSSKVFGVDSMVFLLIILLLGVIGLLAMQKNMRF